MKPEIKNFADTVIEKTLEAFTKFKGDFFKPALHLLRLNNKGAEVMESAPLPVEYFSSGRGKDYLAQVVIPTIIETTGNVICVVLVSDAFFSTINPPDVPDKETFERMTAAELSALREKATEKSEALMFMFSSYDGDFSIYQCYKRKLGEVILTEKIEDSKVDQRSRFSNLLKKL